MGLNSVSVPTYMIKSVINTLLALGSVPPARKDLLAMYKNARQLAGALGRLEGQQSAPRGEEIVAKGTISKAESSRWRSNARIEALGAVFEKEIVPAFKDLDEGCKGQVRFHVILTCAEG